MRTLSRVVVSGLSLTAAFTAFAALKAPAFQLKATPKDKGQEIVASAPKKHHFNLKAPMYLLVGSDKNRVKPTKSTEREVRFAVAGEGPGSANVTLYICDDANTFCEKQVHPVRWNGASGSGASSQAPAHESAQAKSKTTEKKTLRDSHGFLDNQPDEAMRLAKAENKLLLIDFYGIWCPPCNELDDKVFSSKEFKKESSGFVTLKMDADAEGSEKLAQKYKISGFPTVIFATADGDEISRVIGYRPKKDFFEQMQQAVAARGAPFASLVSKADAGDRDARDRLGAIYLNRQDYDLAIRYLEGTQKQREKLLAAELGRVDEKNKEASMKLLEAAIREFPDSPDSIGRRFSLVELHKELKQDEAAKQTHLELIAAAKKIIAKPQMLKGYDNSVGDLWISVALANEALGNKEQEAAAWKSAIAEFRKKMNSGAKRGASLELAYCLRKTGDIAGADKIYRSMEKAYPGEFTYYFSRAYMYFKLDRHEEALSPATQAYENSYGTNRLDTAELLAKVHQKLKQPAEARKIIQETLLSVPTSPIEKGRFKKRIEKLTTLQKELTA